MNTKSFDELFEEDEKFGGKFSVVNVQKVRETMEGHKSSLSRVSREDLVPYCSCFCCRSFLLNWKQKKRKGKSDKSSYSDNQTQIHT